MKALLKRTDYESVRVKTEYLQDLDYMLVDVKAKLDSISREYGWMRRDTPNDTPLLKLHESNIRRDFEDAYKLLDRALDKLWEVM